MMNQIAGCLFSTGDDNPPGMRADLVLCAPSNNGDLDRSSLNSLRARGAAAGAEGFGPTPVVAPTNSLRGMPGGGATTPHLDVSSLNSAPAVTSRRGLFARERMDKSEYINQRIRELRGKLSDKEIGERLGLSESAVWHRATRMGIPATYAAKGNSWTEDELNVLRQAREAGENWPDVFGKLSHRTRAAVRSKWEYLIRHGQMAPQEQGHQQTEPTPTVRFGAADAVRIDFADAVLWMQQANKLWVKPADEREAWRQINAARMGGKHPLPPFLPHKRAVKREPLPAWNAG